MIGLEVKCFVFRDFVFFYFASAYLTTCKLLCKLVPDLAVFVPKRDVKHQPTNQPTVLC